MNRHAFTSMILCPHCGKNFTRQSFKNRAPSWNCSTFISKGKVACHGKQIPEPTLKTVAAQVLGMESFNEDVFRERVEKILVPEDNHLRFILADGQEIETVWRDRSRRESWTEEMRKAASERTQAQRAKARRCAI